MKKCLLFTLFIIICHQSYAQTDTVYFSKEGKVVVNRQDASWYRIIKPQDSGFNRTDYYSNGKTKFTATLSSRNPVVFDGIATWYSEDGLATSKAFYKNNELEDHLIRYYPDGSIKSDAFYKKSTLDGEYKYYYPNKQLKRVDTYSEGKVISGKCYTSSGADMPYFSYLQDPEFIGGAAKLSKYIKANLVYPPNAIRLDITGTVKVKFTVTADGEITNAHLENTLHPLLDDEALRIIKNMPRWKPGLEDNEKRAFSFTLPIEFRLKGPRK